MTVDRKRLRELALALQRAHEALHGMDKHMKVDGYSGGHVRPYVVRAINAIAEFDDALDAAEQPAPDDARRWQWAKRNPVWLGFDHDMMPHQIDAAIDAAIQAQERTP